MVAEKNRVCELHSEQILIVLYLNSAQISVYSTDALRIWFVVLLVELGARYRYASHRYYAMVHCHTNGST